MEKFIFPDLYCPFPSQVNKYVDVLEEYALEWVTRFNLLKDEFSYQRLYKSKFYFLAAGAYPYSQLEELKIANDLLNWVFIWDDQCDASGLGKEPELLEVFHKRFLEILNGLELTNKDVPLTHALSDLRQRILQKMSRTWFLQLVCGFESWFNAYEQEAMIRAQNITPDLDTYIKLRRSSVGVGIFLTLSEMCHQLNISDSLRNHNVIKKLNLMTGDIIAWSNDIFSAPREIESGDVHNLIIVLKYHQQISLKQAMNHVAVMHDQEVKKMINFEASIPCFGEQLNAQVAKYILGCHAWIRSNLDWYSHSDRYQNIESLELVA
ncbi:terpene synthase [Calothrix sp. HK-06]|nr:terpene synthase [Calothrix sp. HK-06]